MPFSDLNLSKPLLQALDDMGLQEPTHIQSESFAVVMSGTDMVGLAQTGTGKTLAYLLPAFRQWTFAKHPWPQILILVPTRELVEQVVEEATQLGKYMNIVVRGAHGGTTMSTQQIMLQEGLDVLVATPGRLYDIAMTGTVKFKHIRKFIVDEVDEMLDLGFRPQLVNVMDLLPEKRQNLLFSATITPEVERLIEEHFNLPVYVSAARSGAPIESIRQLAYEVPNFNTKLNLLGDLLADKARFKRVLVFAPGRRLADITFDRLEELFPGHATVIHSNKAQNARRRALENFQSGDKRILVATGLVSRGLDLDAVSHVINLNIPEEPEDYIHRIGRTGRAGAGGEAITMFSPTEADRLFAAEVLMELEVERLVLPEGLPISKELLIEERPQMSSPTLNTKIPETGGAFHEKSAKRQLVNRGNRKARELRAKMESKGVKKKRR